MNKSKLRCYLTPEIEALSIYTEKGFSASCSQLPQYKEDDDVIIIG